MLYLHTPLSLCGSLNEFIQLSGCYSETPVPVAVPTFNDINTLKYSSYALRNTPHGLCAR